MFAVSGGVYEACIQTSSSSNFYSKVVQYISIPKILKFTFFNYYVLITL